MLPTLSPRCSPSCTVGPLATLLVSMCRVAWRPSRFRCLPAATLSGLAGRFVDEAEGPLLARVGGAQPLC